MINTIMTYFKRKRIEKEFNQKRIIAKEAYRIFIGSNENLNPDNIAKADAFIKGGKFSMKLKW
jgi:hypothetical protein